MRNALFGVIFAALLCGVTLVGIEAISSFFAPPWPARELRWTAPINPISAAREPYASRPWMAEPFNSWGMRDTEHTVAKHASSRPRAIVIGDSFVEASFERRSLPASIEAERNTVETINLGISATAPPSYYYRLRDVGLELSPDVILLFVYMGNDFVLGSEGFGASRFRSFIGDSEGESLLGSVMPRTRWLLKNRWPAVEALWKHPPPPDEEVRLREIAREPRDLALRHISEYMKAYYEPRLPLQAIEEVFSRANDRFWRDLDKQSANPEFLMGWTLDNVLSWETGAFPVAASVEDARRFTSDAEIDATLSWIAAIDYLATSHGVRIRTFIVPVGRVDPDYFEFWKPWPRSYSYNYVCDDREERLVRQAARSGLQLVRLRDVLQGEHGTYRLRDGHWTEKGQTIVAKRVAQELQNAGF
ncbi:MAG: hypothetical protein JSS04_01080 [Proteobacteria bacterium]|nr:hypothetical protein [Pseudomonadota bacterium]